MDQSTRLLTVKSVNKIIKSLKMYFLTVFDMFERILIDICVQQKQKHLGNLQVRRLNVICADFQ